MTKNTNSTLSSTILPSFSFISYALRPPLFSQLQSTPIKLKQGQQIGGGTTNSKPPGPIIMMGQSSETLNSSSSQIIFITLFSAGAKCAIILSQNHFPEPNSHIFLTFLHPILWYRITY